MYSPVSSPERTRQPESSISTGTTRIIHLMVALPSRILRETTAIPASRM